MAATFITHHNESIFDCKTNLTSSESEAGDDSSSRYVSKLHNFVKSDYEIRMKCGKYAHMGPAHIIPPDPREFLKKGTGKLVVTRKHCKLKVPDVKIPKYSTCIPTLKECLEDERKRKKLMEERKKNYISENISYNMNLKPKIPDQMLVINRLGDKRSVTAGLEPKFIYMKKFSKLPKYLKTNIDEIKIQKQQDKDVEDIAPPKCKYITKIERDELLQGMKQNWDDLISQYQKLPVVIDTVSQVRRKIDLEQYMDKLEKDIRLLENHRYIYVYNDTEN